MLMFELPLIVTGPLIIGFLCIYAIFGVFFVRRFVLPRMRIKERDAEFGSGMMQAIMVFYGLAVALIAMNVWQTYSDVSHVVSEEATSIYALYRDVSGYPEPTRTKLQDGLRNYVENLIHVAWPLQQKGKVPTEGVALMTHFQSILIPFEPKTDGQKILHAEALRAYNHMTQARRMRLDAVATHLPGILWFVVIFGALISLTSSFLFKLEDGRAHGIQVVLLATFMGMVIFMILALDRPFIGDLGIRPDSYQLIYDQLIKL